MGDTSVGKSFNLFGSVFTVLGILMGAASLISIVQRWSGIEIVAEIARDALSLYRQIMDQFHWALFSWWTPLDLPWGWTFEMPAWGLDLLVVWTLAAVSNVRLWYFVNEDYRYPGVHELNIRRPMGPDGPPPRPYTERRFVLGVIISIVFAPLDFFRLGWATIFENSYYSSLSKFTWRRKFLDLGVLLAVPGMTVLFYLWNALQLSP